MCPPRRPGESPSLWTCGVAHTLDALVPFLALLFVVLPFQVQGGGEVALEQLRLALNQMAEARDGQDSADEPDDNQDYPDDHSDDHDGGPLTPTDWLGLFSDDVSCLMLL